MRRDRGYTLLELGIVMAVIMVLLTGLALTTSGAFGNARAERTGADLNALLRVAANALKRNLVVQPVAGMAPTYSFRIDAANQRILSNTDPLCFDLSQSAGARDCPPGSGNPGARWNGVAALPLPERSPLLALLGGQVPHHGYNPWCEPYVICFYARRVEVRSCVPTEEEAGAGLVGSGSCGDCAAPSPVTGEATRCILASAPAFSSSAARLRSSYSDRLLFDLSLLLPNDRPNP